MPLFDDVLYLDELLFSLVGNLRYCSLVKRYLVKKILQSCEKWQQCGARLPRHNEPKDSRLSPASAKFHHTGGFLWCQQQQQQQWSCRQWQMDSIHRACWDTRGCSTHQRPPWSERWTWATRTTGRLRWTTVAATSNSPTHRRPGTEILHQDFTFLTDMDLTLQRWTQDNQSRLSLFPSYIPSFDNPCPDNLPFRLAGPLSSWLSTLPLSTGASTCRDEAKSAPAGDFWEKLWKASDDNFAPSLPTTWLGRHTRTPPTASPLSPQCPSQASRLLPWVHSPR